jgi:hypothetical protein
MKAQHFVAGLMLAGFATPAAAGIPTSEKVKCAVGGKSFTITGTMSCSRFGGSQDFLFKVESSCDFVTKLPQCPDNGLPMYKEFTAAEVALLKNYLKGPEFVALRGRSRYDLAKKTDDFFGQHGQHACIRVRVFAGRLAIR